VRRPTSVRIGPFTYRIQYDHAYLESHDADGLFEGSKQLITINNRPVKDVQRAILLHELMHGCVFVTGDDSVKDEETAISAIAVMLYATLRDNPKVTAWILEGTD